MTKRLLKALGLFIVTLALGLSLTLSPVATQTAQLVFGSSSGTAQVIKATSNALWVSIQSLVDVVMSGTTGITFSAAGSAGVGPFTTTGVALKGADGGNYFYVTNGAVTINSATLGIANAGATDIYFRRSAAKTLTIDTDGANGALTGVNVQGPLTSSAALIASTSVNANAGSGFTLVGNAALFSTASKLVQLTSSAGTTGLEFNTGSATLGTCTGGTIVTGSHNQAGGYTGNTSGSCVINFGTPAWTNTPFCFAMSTASLTHPRISAASTSAITITGGVSGEAINYHCEGRIGT
jgi:hypothetical protein